MDSFTIVVEEALLAPTLDCVDATTQTLTFNWSDVGAAEYEVVYTVNGGDPISFTTDQLSFLLDGLSDENDVVLEVTPLGDAPCGNGPTVQTSCSTLPCPPPALAIDFLDASYCSDGAAVALPDLYPGGVYAGPGVSGLSFDPSLAGMSPVTISFSYTDTLTGCSYTIEGSTELIDPLALPVVSCIESTEISVTFEWDATSDVGMYDVVYTVNGMNPTTVTTADNMLQVTGIFPEDVVDITVVAQGSQPCGNSEAAMGSCSALPCPAVPITISGLDAEYCLDGASATLSATPMGGTFSGTGVSGTSFDPMAAGVGTHTISYTYVDPITLCEYMDSVSTEVIAPLETPIITCDDATTQSVSFSWTDLGVASYTLTYSVNGGMAVSQTLVLTSFELTGLNPEDVVDISVIAIGTPPCGNSEAGTQSCSTLACPDVTFDFTPPALICSTDGQIQLEVTVNNQSTAAPVVWSGSAALSAEGIFDPALATLGTNTVTVSISEIGCDYSASFEVEVLPTPIAAFTAGNEICVENSVQVSYQGTATSDANLIWDFDGGDLASGDVGGDFELMWPTPGTYTISLQIDDEGCMSELVSQEVVVVGPLVPTAINCEQVSFTSILFSWEAVANANEYEVVSSTGTGTLNGTSFLVENLLPGEEVSIEVTSIGDTPCGPVMVMGSCITPECPDITIELSTESVICEGEDVVIQLEVMGGQANEMYTIDYMVNGNSISSMIQSGDVLTFPNQGMNLEFELLQFYANSAEVCVYAEPQTIEVQVNTPPEAGQFTSTFEQCQGETENVSLSDLLSGADAGGSWALAQGGSVPGFNAANGTLTTTALAVGQLDFVYTVSGNGICPDDTEMVSVVINPNPVADAGVDQSLDCKDPTVSLQSTNTGVSYEWQEASPGGILGSTTQSSVVVGSAGVYTLVVTNEFGCVDEDQVEVTQSLEAPVAAFSVDEISCFGAEDASILIDSIVGGVAPYEITINGQSTNGLFNLGAGEYVIEVTGANGCNTIEEILIEEPGELLVDLVADINERNLLTFGDSVLLDAAYQPLDRALDTVVWSPIESGELQVWAQPEVETTYTVTIIDENGCVSTDDITIFVERVRPVFIPNVFSPNEDGTNDIFYIQGGEQIREIKSFYVFSRWGESLYEVFNFQPNNPGFGWDGTHRGQEVNSGVYVYIAEIEFNDGEVLLYKGDVTLMR